MDDPNVTMKMLRDSASLSFSLFLVVFHRFSVFRRQIRADWDEAMEIINSEEWKAYDKEVEDAIWHIEERSSLFFSVLSLSVCVFPHCMIVYPQEGGSIATNPLRPRQQRP